MLAGGILLTLFGMNAMNPAGSDFSRLLASAPAERATWALACGIVMVVAGLAGLAGLLPVFRNSQRRSSK